MSVKWQRFISIAIVVLVTLDVGVGHGGTFTRSVFLVPIVAVCPLLLIWHGRKFSSVLSFSANEPPDPKNPGWTMRIIGWIALLLLVIAAEAWRLVLSTGLAAKLYE